MLGDEVRLLILLSRDVTVAMLRMLLGENRLRCRVDSILGLLLRGMRRLLLLGLELLIARLLHLLIMLG